eukprot:6474499-Amphidinium_carterae.1
MESVAHLALTSPPTHRHKWKSMKIDDVWGPVLRLRTVVSLPEPLVNVAAHSSVWFGVGTGELLREADDDEKKQDCGISRFLWLCEHLPHEHAV